MPAQGYERVEADDPDSQFSSQATPDSPPPSFRSRGSSPASPTQRSSTTHVDQTLADAFGGEEDDEYDEQEDVRQRLIRHGILSADDERPSPPRPQIPAFVQPATAGNGRRFIASNDGVFGNLDAKPQAGDNQDELPPSYEQAAADATPPYWETTLMAPGMMSDEVYIDGLPVGSVFSFVWNGVIAMAFPFIGFLLTYLLHTTHAARNGSRAGLAVTLINYGFSVRTAASGPMPGGEGDGTGRPADPNAHDFDPNGDGVFVDPVDSDPSGAAGGGAWLSYLLMIAGWIILIKAVTDFVRARRHEQLVLQSPERNLPVPIVAEGEAAETAV